MKKENKENGIATAAEFRVLAESRAEEQWESPEPVILPGSGLKVILRRPRPGYFTIMGLPLPASIAMRVRGKAPAAPATVEEVEEIMMRMAKLFGAAFVKPRLSIDPKFDEISLNWLHEKDTEFLYRYLVGEVLSGGQDVSESFREPAGRDVGVGADVRDVGVQAERDVARVDH